MTTTEISIDTKKQEIKDKINDLVYEDRLYVLQILKQHVEPSKIIGHADGSRVNLDTLTPELISKIHYIIEQKIAKLDNNP
jgi:hypothetical protein